MSELRPIGTEFDELGGRFRVIGYRSRPGRDPIEEVECLQPVPFGRHKTGRRRFKPPKLDITLPGLPPEVLAALAEVQAAAPRKSPRPPKTTANRKRHSYRHYRATRQVRTPRPKPPPESPWPLVVMLAVIIAVLVSCDALQRKSSPAPSPTLPTLPTGDK